MATSSPALLRTGEGRKATTLGWPRYLIRGRVALHGGLQNALLPDTPTTSRSICHIILAKSTDFMRIKSMNQAKLLVLAVLICGVFLSGCAPETPQPTAAPTLTSTPLPTDTPAPTPTATNTPEPTATPYPAWPNELKLGVPYDNFEALDPERLREMGVSWVVSKSNDPRDIESAHAHGFNILMFDRGEREKIADEPYQEIYVKEVAALATAGADAIVLLSEVNIPFLGPALSPEDYSVLLCDAYAAIKQSHAETDVISAPPASTGFFSSCDSQGCNDDAWLTALYDAGASECMDYVGVEFNSGTTAPDAVTGSPFGEHYTLYLGSVVDTYDTVFRGSRPLFFVSFSYPSSEDFESLNSSFSWVKANNSLADQTSWTLEAVRLAAEDAHIAGLMFNVLRATSNVCSENGDDCDGLWALVRPDGSCPICAMLSDDLRNR